MSEHEQTKQQAEARAAASREDAEARAFALAARAEARVKALIDKQDRRMQRPSRPLPEVDLKPPLARLEKTAKDYITQHLPATQEFREVVSIRAYYRAERRDFAPGREGADWAQAEQEVLDVSPFGNPNPSSDS
jgi:hypothetical protein